MCLFVCMSRTNIKAKENDGRVVVRRKSRNSVRIFFQTWRHLTCHTELNISWWSFHVYEHFVSSRVTNDNIPDRPNRLTSSFREKSFRSEFRKKKNSIYISNVHKHVCTTCIYIYTQIENKREGNAYVPVSLSLSLSLSTFRLLSLSFGFEWQGLWIVYYSLSWRYFEFGEFWNSN